HILLRPAGSINASANDMARYVQFYLNRGAVGGKQIVPAADIDRMEIPESTWAAKDGMKAGYGLSNYWSIEDGFVYHGHDGGVEGGLTEMSYMPDYGTGYFFSINTGNGDAFEKIAKAVRAYITSKLQKPVLPPEVPLPANAEEYAGWYEPDSPRVELTHFIERLAGLSRVRLHDGKLMFFALGQWGEPYVSVSGAQFRRIRKKDSPDPVATLELLTPNQEGRFIQVNTGTTTMRRIPGWFAIGEILAVAFVIVSILAIVIYAPFWILGGISKRRRRPAERAMRLFPLLAVLSLFAFVGIFVVSNSDLIARMGNLTFWSASLWAVTLLFAVASLAGAFVSWRRPEEGVRSGVRRFSILVSLALLIATAYLAYWGIIGLRTWA
ncbi:MAG TPA: hypothetical protein VMU05_22190, partial [Dongiaceae bacterium]|nr:hypothetical protein [Dongiaceae bacterium]